jgi:hypothetical protein
MGNLTLLTTLDISSNLVGTIPDVVRYWTNLQRLKLYQNQITGTLPEWLGELKNLKELAVVPIKPCPGLSGTIPKSLSYIKLETLVLDDNSLTGDIPLFVKDVRVVQIRRNHFDGPCPPLPWMDARMPTACNRYKRHHPNWTVSGNGPWPMPNESHFWYRVLFFLLATVSSSALIVYGIRWYRVEGVPPMETGVRVIGITVALFITATGIIFGGQLVRWTIVLCLMAACAWAVTQKQMKYERSGYISATTI